jgi:hypothetical protein
MKTVNYLKVLPNLIFFEITGTENCPQILIFQGCPMPELFFSSLPRLPLILFFTGCLTQVFFSLNFMMELKW